MTRPSSHEAAPYYFLYIDRVPEGEIVGLLESQLSETLAFLREISEEQSLRRYAPDKWTIREVLNHVNDAERVFLFRAFWFARGFDTPLPSFEEKTSAQSARGEEPSWSGLREEFRAIRLDALSFFRSLSPQAWERSGIASDFSFTVRALAYIAAGHLIHHREILRERYLGA